MAEKKTGKYVSPAARIPSNEPDLRARLGFKNEVGDGKPAFKVSYVVMKQAHVLSSESHKHDYDQILYFFGSDPGNSYELNGEVEFTLSEDGINMEKYVFTTATSVFIPKGLYHCPLIFTRVDKPILHINIFFGEDYQRLK